MNPTNPGDIKAILQKHGASAKKRYGQNFLINPAIPKKIAEAGLEGHIDGKRGVLEIGPGIGALTVELAALYDKVCAVEIDADMSTILQETLTGFDNVELINGDILKTDLSALVRERFGEVFVSVCANLPYYITTPVIAYLLESGIKFTNITVMVQKEVADRFCALPGSADYGAITLFIEYHAETKKLFDVSAGSFYPAPKVKSTIVRLVPRETTPVGTDKESLFQVIRAAFGQRRKTLVNALSSAFPYKDKSILVQAVIEAGGSANIRGEELCLRQFAEITDKIL